MSALTPYGPGILRSIPPAHEGRVADEDLHLRAQGRHHTPDHLAELYGFLPGATVPFAVATDQVLLDCDAMSGDFGQRDSLPPLGCAVVSTAVPRGLGLLALIRMLRARRRRQS